MSSCFLASHRDREPIFLGRIWFPAKGPCEARSGRELELLRKPPPLGGEGGEFEEGRSYVTAARKPPFQQAIPHGMRVICHLNRKKKLPCTCLGALSNLSPTITMHLFLNKRSGELTEDP